MAALAREGVAEPVLSICVDPAGIGLRAGCPLRVSLHWLHDHWPVLAHRVSWDGGLSRRDKSCVETGASPTNMAQSQVP